MVDLINNSDDCTRWRRKVGEQIDSAENVHQIFVLLNPPYYLTFIKFAASALSEKDLGQLLCALPGFVDSKNEEKTERNAGYLVVSHSGGGMLRQGTRKGIRRTPANRGMRAHWVVKGLDISEDVCHGMCP